MSEFLSWYGYDKVDSGYTRGLNLDHFASVPAIHRGPHILPRNFPPKTFIPRSPSSANISFSPNSRSPPASLKDTAKKDSTSSPLSLRTGPASPRTQDTSDSASDSPGVYSIDSKLLKQREIWFFECFYLQYQCFYLHCTFFKFVYIVLHCLKIQFVNCISTCLNYFYFPIFIHFHTS